MAENRGCGMGGGRDTVCIDCGRVLDSCKDKDCFADTRVYLSECGQEVIEKTNSVRVTSTEILGVNIDLEPVQFNRGFYQIYIRFFVKLNCEGCLAPGRSQCFDGICICDKKVILYGSEGNVSIYKSNVGTGGFCSANPGKVSNNLPTAVVECVDPICLEAKVSEKIECCCPCCCVPDDLPSGIAEYFGDFANEAVLTKRLYCTLGFFSVCRIERPAQYLVSAVEYSVPEKECTIGESDDPCTVFSRMSFPTSEFSPPSYRPSCRQS